MAIGRIVEIVERAPVLNQPRLVDAVFFPLAAVLLVDGENGLVFRSPPDETVIARRHAFITRAQFVSALAWISAVQREVLAVPLLQRPRRLDVVAVVEESSQDDAAMIERAFRPVAHGQTHVGPTHEVSAFGDERLISLAVEANERHIPSLVARQLEDRGNVRHADLFESVDIRLRRDHVVRMVTPAAVGCRPLLGGLGVDGRQLLGCPSRQRYTGQYRGQDAKGD